MAHAAASLPFCLPTLSPNAARLDRLGRRGRLAAYRRGQLDRHDLATWAARFPEEVPTVNGEVEWIGLGLADLD